LVVGSGASGYQIADELCRAGRDVVVSVSPHRRAPRRLAGRDLYWWLERLGRFDQTVETLPDGLWPPSTVVTGVDGGYDVDLRTLAAAGVELVGRTVGAGDGVVHFDDDVDAVLAGADEAYVAFVEQARSVLAAEQHDVHVDDDGVPPPERPAPTGAPDAIDLGDRGVTSVVWAIGYDDQYAWIRIPAFDGRGRPVQHRGVTSTPGLYFVGRHWMHTFKSGLLAGVGPDAEHVARHMRAVERL
jgi:putative flavoprotein involved in K+ transport